jgi:hypothetical protein
MRLTIPARTTVAIAAVLISATALALASPHIARSFSPMPAYLPAVHHGESDQPPPSATPARTPSTVPASAEPPTVEPPTAEPPETSTPQRPETTAVPIVVMHGPVDPAAWTVDAYTIQKVAIEGDRLAITVRHGGGCRTHDFHLVTSRLFMESNPVQSDLLLTHDGHGDLCRALITAELVFDLGPLKRTYQHVYPNAPGPIILRLRDWSEPVRYEF